MNNYSMNGKITQFILDMGNGGAERLVRTLSQKLKIDGYENEVICLDNINDYKDEFQVAKIPLINFKRRQCWFDAAIALKLRRHVKKRNIRLIHAHDLSSLSYALAAGKHNGSRVIMTEHSRHYIDEKQIRRIEKRILAMMSDHWIEVSPELRHASIDKDHVDKKRISVVENGIDIDAFKKSAHEKFRSSFGFLEDVPLILFVGRLETIKGPQYLLEALSLAKHPIHKSQALFVGEGSQKKNLIRLAQKLGINERVHFIGLQKNIPKIMKACDLLVIPSESEGLPFVLLEGMAANLPIIATRVGRIPEILGQNKRGVLVEPKSPHALADGICQNLNMSEMAKTRALEARSYVEAYYSQSAMLNNYRKIYQAMLNKS